MSMQPKYTMHMQARGLADRLRVKNHPDPGSLLVCPNPKMSPANSGFAW